MLHKRKKLLPLFSFVLLVFLFSLFLFQDMAETYGSNGNKTGYEKLLNGKPIRYLIIGDSIGRSSGAETPQQTWFTMLEKKIKSTYGSSSKSDKIVQSGSTAFEGFFKFSISDISPNQDFVFIVFGENDRKYMSADQFMQQYEGLLRHVKKTFPRADIVTITESSLKNDQFAQVINVLSDHYHTTHIDMRPVFADSGQTEKQLTKDGIHPNSAGYQLYTDTIFRALEKNASANKQISKLPSPLDQDVDFSFKTVENPDVIDGFFKQGSYLQSEKKATSITYHFTGTMLGLQVLRSPDGGEIIVFIDGKKTVELSTWWPFARERFIYVASSLSEGPHTVRFEVSGTRSGFNQSNQSVVRIAAIITKENP
ncbi:GDSL-type esterase/lipase family protein [Peribacillus psychrosaccharolyticus]|uniref:GDSL-type esterase/lipase family protein n=1 Tax=Peribacillus psychrosaccharolyticus TaxID=1407 RepID=UPI003D265275